MRKSLCSYGGAIGWRAASVVVHSTDRQTGRQVVVTRGFHYSDLTQMWADPGDASPNLATRDPRESNGQTGGGEGMDRQTQHNSQPELNRPPTGQPCKVASPGRQFYSKHCSTDWRLVTFDISPRFSIDASLKGPRGLWRIRSVGCVKHMAKPGGPLALALSYRPSPATCRNLSTLIDPP